MLRGGVYVSGVRAVVVCGWVCVCESVSVCVRVCVLLYLFFGLNAVYYASIC